MPPPKSQFAAFVAKARAELADTRSEAPDERRRRVLLDNAERSVREATTPAERVAAGNHLLAVMKATGEIVETQSNADAPAAFVIEFAEPPGVAVPAEPEEPSAQTYAFPALDRSDAGAEPGRRRGAA